MSDLASPKFLRPNDRFFSLTYIDTIQVSRGTDKPTRWRCDCGRETVKCTGNVTKGTTKTCGRCKEVSIEEQQKKFGKLRIKFPRLITSGSAKKLECICDCGRETSIAAFDILGNNTLSCGHCNNISADELALKKFGKLQIVTPVEVSPSSHKRVKWICDCGKLTSVEVRYVVSGTVKTCGKCNEISAGSLDSQKFNRLKLRDVVSLKSGSNKKVWWVCDCGGESFAQVVAVMSGRTKSCGKCHLIIRAKFEENKEEIRKLRTPIQPNQLPDWAPLALEPILNVKTPFKAQCRLCGGEYSPRWGGVRLGVSLTCGCSSSRVSSGQNEIFKFIEDLGLNPVLEHKVGNLPYDIFVPSRNLVVEFNGLRWHSKPDSKSRDTEKYRNAKKNGLNFLMIFEDEWRLHPQKVKSLIINKLGLTKPKNLRPSQCEIRRVHWSEVDPLYEAHHYIGPAKAPINYGIFFQEKIIGSVSFKHPTRQSSYEWELIRMVMNPEFRVHGVWSKIILQFISESSPKSIVSFSDNRLFDGKVYEKMGFKHDGDLRPDYYWTRSDRRFHKSGLRKTKTEKLTGKTEYELREAQGYLRIWDLGKKRWIYGA